MGFVWFFSLVGLGFSVYFITTHWSLQLGGNSKYL